MQIHISFDYELFFGNASGSAQKCILEPTQKLIDIATKHKVPFIFFRSRHISITFLIVSSTVISSFIYFK